MGSIIRHCHVPYWHHYGARVTPQQNPTLRNGNFSISEIVALNQKKYPLRVISDRVFLEIKKTLLRNTAMCYKHLNIDEREGILKMRAEGKSMEEAAHYPGRNKVTINWELRRNKSSTDEYKPHLAQKYYRKRRKNSKRPYRLADSLQISAWYGNCERCYHDYQYSA